MLVPCGMSWSRFDQAKHLRRSFIGKELAHAEVRTRGCKLQPATAVDGKIVFGLPAGK